VHDVAVVGAGLAGLATAIQLARRGRSVVVAERADGPQRKACGEGLFPYGVAEALALGLDLEAAGAAPLHELRFHAGGRSAAAPLGAGGPGLGLRRDELSASMHRLAATEGVDVRSGTAVRGLIVRGRRVAALGSSGGPIEARAFVAADGLGSRLRTRAGLDDGRPGSRYGVSAHLAMAELSQAIDVHFHDGYEVYRTPVAAGSANVAILLEKRLVKAFAGRATAAFREMLGGHPAAGASPDLEDEPLVAGPFSRGCRRRWRGNLVLVGDAAGFFDGISGDGMSAALVEARLCAAAVDAFLVSGSFEPFKRYERECRARQRASNLLARVMLGYARQPWAARFAVGSMARHPETLARLVSVAADGGSIRRLRARDAAALLFGV
jgi:flavin-dependent dehydrogenase